MVKVISLDEKIDDETRRENLLDIAKSFFLSLDKKFINSGYAGRDETYSFHVGWENDQDGYVIINVFPIRNQIIVRYPKHLDYGVKLAEEYIKTREGEFTVVKNYKE